MPCSELIDRGELVLAPLEHLAEREHDASPPGERHVTPFDGRLAGALDRGVDLGRAGQRDLRLHRAGGRVEDLGAPARRGIPRLAVDPVLHLAHQRPPGRFQPRASRADRRWPNKVPTASTMMLPNRIIEASTLICGGVAVRDCPKIRTGKVVVLGPETKYVMMKSSIDSANDSRNGREDPGNDQRQRDPEERARRVRAEVHRRVLERPVEAPQSGLDRERDVAHAEHDVRDQDRREPELEAVVEQHEVRLEEQREQRRAEHDLGRGERQDEQEVDAVPAPEPVAHQRDRDERPEDRRDGRRRSARSRGSGPARRPAPCRRTGAASSRT